MTVESMHVWYAEACEQTPEGAVRTVIGAFHDTRHPDRTRAPFDGTVEELLAHPDRVGCVEVLTSAGRERVLRLELPGGALGMPIAGAPALAFVVLVEAQAEPPAVTLLAFAQEPHGMVLGPDEARARGITPDQQVGALRWLPGSGAVHQVFVAPQWRRRRIAATLFVAAEMVRTAHRWPALSGGDARTDLGHEMLQAWPDWWTTRLQPRTKQAPAMDVAPLSLPVAPGDVRPTGGAVRVEPPR